MTTLAARFETTLKRLLDANPHIQVLPLLLLAYTDHRTYNVTHQTQPTQQ